MPELYIGNISKQIYQFAYRSLERPGVIYQTIPIGGQIRVSPNGSKAELTTPEIDYILDQHKTYGLIAIEELDSITSLTGLCYGIGKALTAEKLHRAMRKKEESLIESGRKIRKEAAVAVNSQIEDSIGGHLQQLEMSFTEEEPRAGFTDDTDHVAEGVRVTRLETDQGRRARR